MQHFFKNWRSRQGPRWIILKNRYPRFEGLERYRPVLVFFLGVLENLKVAYSDVSALFLAS